MLAPFLSLAFFAAEVSGAIALPQEMELPLPSGVETGTNSPITPASSRTAPTAMINRRTVTIRLSSEVSVRRGLAAGWGR